MSFFGHNVLNTLNSNFDERQWVEQLRKTLDEELEEITEIPVTIFGVPKTLMIINPDSYIPHYVAIGPYHRLKPDLYDMERYKIAAAKRSQRELESDIKFQHIVDHIRRFELRIRANYHRPLSYNAETLGWMMAVDASFLYEFLQVCSVKELGNKLAKTPSRLALLTDLSGNTTAFNSIIKDIVMLENQIPMFVTRMILEFQFSSQESADEMLGNMLVGLCKELSPFKMAKSSCDQYKTHVKLCAHILDFLYQYMVPKFESSSDETIDIRAEELEEIDAKPSAPPSHLRQLADDLWSILSKLENGPVQWVKGIIFSKPVKTVVTLPWTMVTKIPVLNVVKGPVEHVFGILGQKNKEKKDDDEDPSSKAAKPPVLEEISIPSVTQLFEIGVKFSPTNEGIESIDFDPKTATFRIPIIDLDVNSEIVLRNLVAYEACSANKGPLILARYTELMNGIIDTDEDAKLLCEKGIIINHLKSEKEVANLWNGMSKSVKLTKVPSLDKVIADVNKYYSGRFKVKFKKFMTKYVFGSWKILTFLATIMLLVLMSLQAFCQVYSCGRIVRIKGLEPAN